MCGGSVQYFDEHQDNVFPIAFRVDKVDTAKKVIIFFDQKRHRENIHFNSAPDPNKDINLSSVRD